MDKLAYTKEQLDIELLKQKSEEFYRTFSTIDSRLSSIETIQRWMLGLMGSGFLCLFGFIAHGFHWIN